MRLLSHANADKKKWHCYIPEVLTENELNKKGLIVYLQKLKKLKILPMLWMEVKNTHHKRTLLQSLAHDHLDFLYLAYIYSITS